MKKSSCAAFFILQLLFSASAFSQGYWNLPQELNDQNTTISYTIESTWHDVQGRTSNITGKAWLLDKNNYASIAGEVIFPVAAMETGNESRDEKMMKVMDEPAYHQVSFRISSIENLPNPEELKEEPLPLKIRGILKIRDVQKPVIAESVVRKSEGKYYLQSNFMIDWQEFGVKDPSILIAKVYPNVQIKVNITL